MSIAGKVLGVALLAALGWAAVAQAQPPIRIGATASQTGVNATISQNILRGYQLCAKHTNDKGGVLGRKLELVVYDDQSDPATAVRLYEQLITQDKVDLVLGPYGSPITDAVADVTEKHKIPMVAPAAGVTSIYRKGRKLLFSLLSPGEFQPEGLIDLAAKKGLKTVALINGDNLFGRAVTQGTVELAKKMKALNVNPRMVGLTPSVDVPKFYEVLGRDAEFVYGATQWLPELVDLRAGGLIPIARQYPGAREFVESYKREFPGDLSYSSASGYGGCQILVEAIRRAGSLDSGKLRETILKMDRNTVFGGFRVDRDGLQIAHKLVLFQWQEGKRAIVWPEELAPDQPRFPTPPWSQRP